MMNEMKMPASYAAIDCEEMTYLIGGADSTTTSTSFTDSDFWKTTLQVGQVFNYIARVFSASSSIINNFNTIFTSISTLNSLISGLISG